MTIEYVRYALESPAPALWRPKPGNAVLVAVPGTEKALTLEEGKRLARETMARLAAGEIQGEERPYELPRRAERVAELDHPTKALRAIVVRWPDAYEVWTIGCVPDGYTLPVSTPSLSTEIGYEWGRLDLFERLLADTEEEALSAAREELDRLAVADLPVRDRPSGSKG